MEILKGHILAHFDTSPDLKADPSYQALFNSTHGQHVTDKNSAPSTSAITIPPSHNLPSASAPFFNHTNVPYPPLAPPSDSAQYPNPPGLHPGQYYNLAQFLLQQSSLNSHFGRQM